MGLLHNNRALTRVFNIRKFSLHLIVIIKITKRWRYRFNYILSWFYFPQNKLILLNLKTETKSQLEIFS